MSKKISMKEALKTLMQSNNKIFKESVNEDEDNYNLEDDFKNVNAKRAADYKKYAHIEDGQNIDKDNLDNWALGVAGTENTCSPDEIKEAVLSECKLSESKLTESQRLVENPTIDQAVKDVEAQAAAVDSPANKTYIETILDDALDNAQINHSTGAGEFPNVLLIGQAGSGKSSIVRQWARKNSIALYEVRAAGMDPTDLGGVITINKDNETAKRIPMTEFLIALDRPNSVLFLDEYNRAPKSVRTNLLSLVQDHVINDPREPDGQKHLENLLFTIAAINPSANADYNTDMMDTAERDRFSAYDIPYNKAETLRFLIKQFDSQIEKSNGNERVIKKLEGRKALAQAILTNKYFSYDDEASIAKGRDNEGDRFNVLSPRSLTRTLDICNGTKEDFLNKFQSTVNRTKLGMMKQILNDYKDVDDKANDVLKTDTKSSVFSSAPKSNWQKIADAFPDFID